MFLQLKLYTTIPHKQLKSRLSGLIRSTFISKNGSRRYKYVLVKYNTAYLVKDETDSPNKYSETDIIRMVELLLCGIWWSIYQQNVDIPMGTNCALLVPDLFLYSYEADCVQHIQPSKFKKQKASINLIFRYIDNVLSLKNPKFNDILMLFI